MKTSLKAVIPPWIWNPLRRSYHQLTDAYARYVLHDYSQAGETTNIRKLLGKEKRADRFFVEVGANDGLNVSSTFGLVKDGWRGLAVEANPQVYARLKHNWQGFPQVKTVCLAVAPVRGPIKLYLGKSDPDGLLSTISTENSEWFNEHRSEDFVEVPGVPLTELLDEEMVPGCPDLLLVDAEGMDYDILCTLDFQKYRPKLIITEDYEPKNPAKFQLLEGAGYTLIKQLGCNTFWMDQLTADRRENSTP